MILLNMSGVNIKAKDAFGGLSAIVLNFIAPIVLLGLSVAAIVLYVLPAYKVLPVLKEKLTKNINDVEALKAKVAQLTYLDENKDLVIGDLVKMSWAFEERDKVPELSEQVRKMCTDSGVTFSTLDYVNENKIEAGTEKPIDLTITPDPALYREEKVSVTINAKDLTALVNFLKTAENSIRLFRVQGIGISSKDATYDVSFAMASPYLNPSFSAYSETAAPIDLANQSYRDFMVRLDTFKNYAKEIDSTLPKI